MELGPLIGKGNTAEVYQISEKEVLKLFFENISYELIKKEFETSSLIHQLGIPTPYTRELTQFNNRWGIVYEKISGSCFTDQLSAQTLKIKENARIFAELQASYHEKSTEALPLQKAYLSWNISATDRISPEEKELILNYLETLPEDNKVCHGDYHSDNIIFGNGQSKILDWMTGTSGHPCADVARTMLIMKYAYLPPSMPKATKMIIQIVRNLFTRNYFNTYIKLTGRTMGCIEQWLLPVMAARLVEGIPAPEKQFLIHKIHKELVQKHELKSI